MVNPWQNQRSFIHWTLVQNGFLPRSKGLDDTLVQIVGWIRIASRAFPVEKNVIPQFKSQFVLSPVSQSRELDPDVVRPCHISVVYELAWNGMSNGTCSVQLIVMSIWFKMRCKFQPVAYSAAAKFHATSFQTLFTSQMNENCDSLCLIPQQAKAHGTPESGYRFVLRIISEAFALGEVLWIALHPQPWIIDLMTFRKKRDD